MTDRLNELECIEEKKIKSACETKSMGRETKAKERRQMIEA
jgi:hypothetical protein